MLHNYKNEKTVEFVPPPLYPPLINKPLNLEQNEKISYLVNIKQSLRNSMKDSVFYFIDQESEKSNFNNKIERYSDKYSKQKGLSSKSGWKVDWKILPKELKYFYCKKKSKKSTTKNVKRIVGGTAIISDFNLKTELGEENLNENEEGEEENEDTTVVKTNKDKDDDNEKKSEKENDSENEEKNEDDEEMEEVLLFGSILVSFTNLKIELGLFFFKENDYIDDYFDNGENDDHDDGGDDDGGTY